MKLTILTIVIILPIFVSKANAIVNMDNLHLNANNSGVSGNFNLNSSGAYGNSEQFLVESSADFYYKQSQSLQYLTLSYSYGESFSKENQNKSYAHLRHINNVDSSSTWEIFSQIEQNKFSRLNFRGLVGAGYRWKFLKDSPNSSSVFGVGAYYSEEYLTHSNVINEKRNLELLRGNIYWIFRTDILENITLFNTTYYQPNLKNPDDYRILEIAGIKIPLSKNLNLNLYGEGTFDSKPPINVKKADLSYKTGVEYKF